MIDTLQAGALAGLGIAVPIGAVGAYLVALTARTSWRAGAAGALGVASVDGLYAVVAVTAGQLAAGLIQQVERPLRIVAAVILFALAVKSIMDGWRRYRAEPDASEAPQVPAAHRSYLTFVAITLVNPTTVVYFAALVAGGQGRLSPGIGAGLLFALAAFVASACWQLTLAAAGALLGRSAASPRGRLITALGSAVIIAVLAVRTALRS